MTEDKQIKLVVTGLIDLLKEENQLVLETIAQNTDIDTLISYLVTQHCFTRIVDALVNNLTEKLNEVEHLKERLHKIESIAKG